MYGYIYITTNTINGKMYIGQKKSTKFLNEKYLGSGSILKKAIQKYGKENFKVELLCECESKEELDEMEQYYIKKYNAQSDDNFYNLTKGGESGLGGPKFKGHTHTYETKQKISNSVSGKNNGFYGKHHSESTKNIMKEKAKNRKPVSEKTREKMSSARKGIKFTEDHKRKISESQRGSKGNNYGKKLPLEVKNKISCTVSNQVWMNDGERSYRIPKDLVEEYIQNGYKKGRLSFKKGSTTIES